MERSLETLINQLRTSRGYLLRKKVLRIIYLICGLTALAFSFYFSAKSYVEYYKLKEATNAAEMFFPGSEQFTKGLLDNIWMDDMIFSILLFLLAVTLFILVNYSRRSIKTTLIHTGIKEAFNKTDQKI